MWGTVPLIKAGKSKRLNGQVGHCSWWHYFHLFSEGHEISFSMFASDSFCRALSGSREEERHQPKARIAKETFCWRKMWNRCFMSIRQTENQRSWAEVTNGNIYTALCKVLPLLSNSMQQKKTKLIGVSRRQAHIVTECCFKFQAAVGDLQYQCLSKVNCYVLLWISFYLDHFVLVIVLLLWVSISKKQVLSMTPKLPKLTLLVKQLLICMDCLYMI